MKIGRWSTSAASNTATPPDGWPEGMAPSAVNDAARELMAQVKTYANDAEWFDRDFTPTFVNSNSFTVTGDQTDAIVAGRQLKLYDASTIYRYVESASYTAVTTIQLGSGSAITASLTSFAVGALSPVYRSEPQRVLFNGKIGAPQSMSAGVATTVIFQGTGAGAISRNTFSWYSQTVGSFLPKWPGYYQFNATLIYTGNTLTPGQGQRAEVYVNGSGRLSGPRTVTTPTDTVVDTAVTGMIYLNGVSDSATIKLTHIGENTTLDSSSYLQIYYIGP